MFVEIDDVSKRVSGIIVEQHRWSIEAALPIIRFLLAK